MDSSSQDSTWGRYVLKFKQQPLIPIGVFATCIAFAGATRQLRSGDRASFNRWLRFRVLAQGFTVAVAVIAGWQISQDRKAARQSGAVLTSEEDTTTEKEAAERRRFEARMTEAVEAHRLESGGKSA